MTLRETFDQAWADVTSRATCVVQDKEELFALIALMHARGVRSYLELGASEGVSLYCIGMCLSKGAVIGAIDLCEPHSREHLFDNVQRLRDAGHHATVYVGTTADAHNDLETYFNIGSSKMDAILIDADHTYESVSEDWALYGNLGKMVAFHDIRIRETVGRVWEKVKGNTVEIHNYDCGQRWGFGVRFNA